MGKPFPDPPEAAVSGGHFQFGRYGSPFPRANLLEVERPYHYRVPRAIKEWRLKEWQALQFGDERWFYFSALYNAKLFSLAVFHAYDRVERRRIGFQRILPGSAFRFSERLVNSQAAYRSRQYALDFFFDLDAGSIRVAVERAGSRGRKEFSGSFHFGYGPKVSAPNVVLLPLGLNRAMYSTKVLMPLEGEFMVDGESFHLDSPAAMGILDDHKGYYPWRMRYDWVTGFGLDGKGRRAGFNLTDNQVKDQEHYNENCLWIGNKVWPLPPVKVSRAEGPAGSWVIQDTEGLVDLVFTPEVHNDIRFNLGVIESDYHGPFGTFKGLVKNGEGEKLEADRLFGAGEQKYLRA